MRLIVLFSFMYCYNACLAQQQLHLAVQTGHAGGILKVAVSADDRFLFTAGIDRDIVVWHIEQQRQFATLSGHSAAIKGMVCHNNYLWTIAEDSALIAWDYANASLASRIMVPGNPFAVGTYLNRIVVSTNQGVFTLENNQFKRISELNTIVSFSVMPNALIMLSAKGLMYAIKGGQNKEVKLPYSKVASLAADTLLYFTTFDGKLLRIAEGKSVSGTTSALPLIYFNNVKANAKGQVAVSQVDGKIHFYTDKKWERVTTVQAHQAAVTELALTSSGKELISVGLDGAIHFWDMATGRKIAALNGTTVPINHLCFAQDGSVFIAYNNGLLRRHHLITGQNLAVVDFRESMHHAGGAWQGVVSSMKRVGQDTLLVDLLAVRNSKVSLGTFDRIVKHTAVVYANGGISLCKNSQKSKGVAMYRRDVRHGLSPNPKTLIPAENKVFKAINGQVLAFVNNDSLIIYNGLRRLAVLHSHGSLITSVSVDTLNSIVATAGWDGLIEFRERSTGELISTLGAFGKEDFILIHPEKYYFASKGALDAIAFRSDGELYGFEQFDLRYNRPDKVLAPLPYSDSLLIAHYFLAVNKRFIKSGYIQNREDVLKDIPVLNMRVSKVAGEPSNVWLHVQSTAAETPLKALFIEVNGVPEHGREGIALHGERYQDSVKVTLSEGLNRFKVYVTNYGGINSLARQVSIPFQGDNKPDLYLITIGVSSFQQSQFDLKYAAKDAGDVSRLFEKSKLYNRVYLLSLQNEQVKLESLSKVSDFLKNSQENDRVMLFAAGHGVLDSRLDYFFASHDMDFNNPQHRGIPYESLEGLLNQSKSRNKVFFLDACHSGEVDKDEMELAKNETPAADDNMMFRGDQHTVVTKGDINIFDLARAMFADMRQKGGIVVVSSAGAAEYALESDQWKNGIFTLSLIDGVRSGAADLNRNKKITISELQKYLQREVFTRTNGRQKPVSRVENLQNDFTVERK